PRPDFVDSIRCYSRPHVCPPLGLGPPESPAALGPEEREYRPVTFFEHELPLALRDDPEGSRFPLGPRQVGLGEMDRELVALLFPGPAVLAWGEPLLARLILVGHGPAGGEGHGTRREVFARFAKSHGDSRRRELGGVAGRPFAKERRPGRCPRPARRYGLRVAPGASEEPGAGQADNAGP